MIRVRFLLALLYVFLFTDCECDSSVSHISEIEEDLKLRHSMHREHKKRHKVYASQVSSRFGQELPSFAFDFSDLFIGAVVERSLDSDDLHLAMMVMGKKTLSLKDKMCPFTSVSTDLNTIESWTKAVANNLPGPNYTHAGLSCRLQNEATQQPYYTSASWIPSSAFSDGKHNGMIEILRCRVKHVAQAYRSLSHSDESLHIDIIRRQVGLQANTMNKRYLTPPNPVTSRAGSDGDKLCCAVAHKTHRVWPSLQQRQFTPRPLAHSHHTAENAFRIYPQYIRANDCAHRKQCSGSCAGHYTIC